MRRLTHQHLVQHAPQGVDITRGTRLTIRRSLLRAHIVRSAHGQARLGQPPAPGRTHRKRDSEVCHEWAALTQQDIRRLDVPVDHTPLMGSVKGLGNVGGDPHRLLHRKLMLSVELIPE